MNNTIFTAILDNIPYKLKSPFDFSFLQEYGRVFKIYDGQDSGSICFCMTCDKTGKRHFIKFAGAPTVLANVSPEEAIARMRGTIKVYQDLAHPNLTQLLDSFDVAGGIAMVFEWHDAEYLGKQYPASREKFLQLGKAERLGVFDDIIQFHLHVAACGYVAIDFYDGSIMYDFKRGKTIICDIELYAKSPQTNTMGRMCGSSTYMSPEEFTLGATIDEVTNVYTMGAAAFVLFGGGKDREFDKWRLSRELFEVATSAVSAERGNRQQTIAAFAEEWRMQS